MSRQIVTLTADPDRAAGAPMRDVQPFVFVSAETLAWVLDCPVERIEALVAKGRLPRPKTIAGELERWRWETLALALGGEESVANLEVVVRTEEGLRGASRRGLKVRRLGATGDEELECEVAPGERQSLQPSCRREGRQVMVAQRRVNRGLPRYVEVRVTGGREVYYFRRQSASGAPQRVPLKGVPFDAAGEKVAAWWEAYAAALGPEKRKKKVIVVPDADEKDRTFAQLIAAYKIDPAFLDCSEKTRRLWLRHLQRIEDLWGDLKVADLESKNLLYLKAAYSQHRADADNMMRLLSTLLTWSVKRGYRQWNPCFSMGRDLLYKNNRHYSAWQWREIKLIEAHGFERIWWVAAVALFTGQRLGDCLKMKWGDERQGVLEVVPGAWAEEDIGIEVEQEKTKKRLLIPLHARLKPVWDSIPRVSEYVLTNTKGEPWTASGFQVTWRAMFKGFGGGKKSSLAGKVDARQNKLRAQAERRIAALKPIKDRQLVFHGLRKSAVVMLLEAGCTEAMVSAITGQTPQMVALYARDVNNARLARAGMAAWEKSWQQEPKGNGFGATADVGPPDLGADWAMALPEVLAQVDTEENLRLMAACAAMFRRRDGFKRRGRQGRFVVRQRVRELGGPPVLLLPPPDGG